MSDLRKAAKMALEALEWHYAQGNSNTLGGIRLKIDEKALRTLKAALAQPEPAGAEDMEVYAAIAENYNKPWAPMSERSQEPEQEWLTGCPECGLDRGCDCDSGTCDVPEQAPFGWLYESKAGSRIFHLVSDDKRAFHADMDAAEEYPEGHKMTPLFTAPPQRKPLTEEEIVKICVKCWRVTPSEFYFARAIEKAHGIGGEE